MFFHICECTYAGTDVCILQVIAHTSMQGPSGSSFVWEKSLQCSATFAGMGMVKRVLIFSAFMAVTRAIGEAAGRL